ncbi:hypothetical protein V6N12_049197 [Hibiscus sabdariffa]|uniref:RNase H type-1 domain-containing protein n=1 Tax=Hibiscus sabdariffa TaxID=183260 RepID=A0ABR2EJH0_9ROSI
MFHPDKSSLQKSIKHDEVLITILALWFSRNKRLHKGIIQTKEKIITFIKAYCLEFSILSASIQRFPSVPLVHWEPPTEDFVKVNFDASFNLSSSETCYGVLVHDSHGLVMRACCRKSSCVPSSFAVEVLATIHAIEFSVDMGFPKIVVEGELLPVIKKSGNRVARIFSNFGMISSTDIFWVEEFLI